MQCLWEDFIWYVVLVHQTNLYSMVIDHFSWQVSMETDDSDLEVMIQKVLMYYSWVHMNHVQSLVLVWVHVVQMCDTKHRIVSREVSLNNVVPEYAHDDANEYDYQSIQVEDQSDKLYHL